MLVLASASPRRQEILRNANISFEVHPADIDETPHASEKTRAHVERLAREKALKISAIRPKDFVLGADTIVAVDEVILGKPSDAADAARMLRLLSGRSHQVITGVCLAATGIVDVRSQTTLVAMDKIPDEEIASYAASSEPMDKAGAYAIQGIASRWVSRIEGDYFNVVGLPVALVWRMLRENGFPVPA